MLSTLDSCLNYRTGTANSPIPTACPQAQSMSTSQWRQSSKVFSKHEPIKGPIARQPSDQSEDGDKLIIKANIKRPKRLIKDRTWEQKRYRKLVQTFKEAWHQNANRPPRFDYKGLLQAIGLKIDELNNTKERYEEVFRRCQGTFDRYIWITERILQRAEQTHATKAKTPHVVVAAKGIDELDVNAARACLDDGFALQARSSQPETLASYAVIQKIFHNHVISCLKGLTKGYEVAGLDVLLCPLIPRERNTLWQLYTKSHSWPLLFHPVS